MATASKNFSLRKSGGKKMVTESKVTMNFARHKSDFNLTKVAIIGVCIILAAVLFTQFAILVPIQEKTLALTELSARQDQLGVLNARLAGWDALQQQYGRYSYGWMTEGETSLVDRMEILSLMEKKIASVATVEDFSISGNVLTVNLEGMTLEQTSSLVTVLESDPLVTSATVYKASNDDAEIKEVNMVIILSKVVQDNG